MSERELHTEIEINAPAENEKSESIKALQILQNIGPATAEKLYNS